MGLGIARRDRRALVVGGVVVAAGVLFARGLPALRAWNAEAHANAEELRAELLRAEAAIGSRPALRDTLQARAERLLSLGPALLDGETPAAAAATLGSLLSGAAATGSLRLGAVQVTYDSADATAFTWVAARADAVGDIRGLTHMLLALERGPALLAVRELSVTQPEPGAAADRPEALRLDLVVHGLALDRARKQ